MKYYIVINFEELNFCIFSRMSAAYSTKFTHHKKWHTIWKVAAEG